MSKVEETVTVITGKLNSVQSVLSEVQDLASSFDRCRVGLGMRAVAREGGGGWRDMRVAGRCCCLGCRARCPRARR
jgi:hypothetical protein